jgi:cysteine-rich repeat protein
VRKQFRRRGEECDDGNDVAGDGCTQCKLDPKVCDANGLTVELTLDFPEDFLVACRPPS